jgi:hypothetical protein
MSIYDGVPSFLTRLGFRRCPLTILSTCS